MFNKTVYQKSLMDEREQFLKILSTKLNIELDKINGKSRIEEKCEKDTQNALILKAQNGDINAEEFLIWYNIPLIIGRAWKETQTNEEFSDFISTWFSNAKNIINKYDQEKRDFSSFFPPRVKWAYQDKKLEERGISKYSDNKIKKLRKAEDNLWQVLQRDPTQEELAKEMGETLEQIRDILYTIDIHIHDPESLDITDEDGNFKETEIPDPPKYDIEEEEVHLTEKEQAIFDFWVEYEKSDNSTRAEQAFEKFRLPLTVLKFEGVKMARKSRNEDNDVYKPTNVNIADNIANEKIGDRDAKDLTRVCQGIFDDEISYDYQALTPEQAIKYLKKAAYTMDFGFGIARLIYEKKNKGTADKEIFLSSESARNDATDCLYKLCEVKKIPFTKEKIEKFFDIINGTGKINVRDDFFKIAFALELDHKEVHNFLLKEMGQQTFRLFDLDESILLYAFANSLIYSDYTEIKEKFIEKCNESGTQEIPENNDMTKTMWDKLAENYFARHNEKKEDSKDKFINYLYSQRFIFGKYCENKYIPINRSSNSAKTAYNDLLNNVKNKLSEILRQEKVSNSEIVDIIMEGRLRKNVKVKGEYPFEPLEFSALYAILLRISDQRIGHILNGHRGKVVHIQKEDIIILKFLLFCLDIENVKFDAIERLQIFEDEVNAILSNCWLGKLYIPNRFDNFIMLSLLYDDPLEYFTQVLQKSFEWHE